MNTKFSVILRNPVVMSALVGVTSAVGGFAAGYIVGKRNGDVFEIPQEALDEMDEDRATSDDPILDAMLAEEADIARRYREEKDSTLHIPMVIDDEPITVIDKPVELVVTEPEQRTTYNKPVKPVEAPTYEVDLQTPVNPADVTDADSLVNVFDIKDPYWNFENELASRTPNAPYVIHADEYTTEESGLRQASVTYYAGDDIMANELDTPIYDHARIFGELKFGHGSKDPGVVYIRNERERMEWEVILHSGHYAVEVQGLQQEAQEEGELRHGHTPRKFRGE